MKLGTEIGLNYDSAIAKLKILLKYKVIITYANLLESQSGEKQRNLFVLLFLLCIDKGFALFTSLYFLFFSKLTANKMTLNGFFLHF